MHKNKIKWQLGSIRLHTIQFILTKARMLWFEHKFKFGGEGGGGMPPDPARRTLAIPKVPPKAIKPDIPTS